MTTTNQTLNNKVQQLDVGGLSEYKKLVEMVRSINYSCDTALYQATSHQHDLMKYNVVLPSGPRLAYEGLHEDKQKVINAQIMGEGVVVLKVTLLAAGFVVGTKGRSIHSISEMTGCTIKSWTLYYNVGNNDASKALRAFKISGPTSGLLKAMQIITAAVDRYKELTEGEFTGQSVNRDQVIDGITFEYRPPPKRFIPKSARTIQQHDPPSSKWEAEDKVYNSQDSFSSGQQYSSGRLQAQEDLPSYDFYYPSSPDYSPRDISQNIIYPIAHPQHSLKTYNVPHIYPPAHIPPYATAPTTQMYSTPIRPAATALSYAPMVAPASTPTPTPNLNYSPMGQYVVQPNFYMQHCPVRFSSQPTTYSWW